MHSAFPKIKKLKKIMILIGDQICEFDFSIFFNSDLYLKKENLGYWLLPIN